MQLGTLRTVRNNLPDLSPIHRSRNLHSMLPIFTNICTTSNCFLLSSRRPTPSQRCSCCYYCLSLSLVRLTSHPKNSQTESHANWIRKLVTHIYQFDVAVGSDLPLSILIAFESRGMPCFTYAEFSGGSVVSNSAGFSLFSFSRTPALIRSPSKRLAICQ